MRRILCAAAVAAMTLPAAAGEPVSWTGFYLGAHGGYGWADWDGDFAYDGTDLGYGYQLGTEGGFGGLQIGANYQTGSTVLGIEADVSWGDFGGSGVFQANDAGPTSYTDWEIDQEIEQFGTVRARLGYTPTERLLVYATGGLAWAQTSASETVHYSKYDPPFVNAVGSADETHVGWTAGAGLEWALGPNLTVRGEYLYADLGEADYDFAGSAGKALDRPYAKDSAASNLDLHTVRVGLNYAFH